MSHSLKPISILSFISEKIRTVKKITSTENSIITAVFSALICFSSTVWSAAEPLQLVKKINQTYVPYSQSITEIINIGGVLYYSSSDPISGVELWKSDGTDAGSVLIADINPTGDSNPALLTDINGTLYFRADDGTNGVELWKSDGTAAGTVMVANISPTSGSSSPTNLTNINGIIYFAASDGSNGFELWSSDGTAAGTVMVKDINPTASSSPASLTNINGTLFFTANDGANGTELWSSDGTTAGTVMLANINPAAGTGSNPSYFTNVNSALYFVANDGTNGAELWKSDGTAAGTAMVADINPTAGAGALTYNSMLTNVNGIVFFAANDGISGSELWSSDGTAAGTVMVADINPTAGIGGTPQKLINVNGTLYFSANDGTNGSELWLSDGTAAGTLMVADINPTGNSGADYLTNVNGALFFAANDGTNGLELWKSDGTAAGTILVENIHPTYHSFPEYLTGIVDTVYFSADDGANGVQLWKSNGTVAGTTPVKIVVGLTTKPSNPGHYTRLGDLIYFTADDVNGNELWKTDGTELGTSMVADINPTGDSLPNYLVNVNGTLFFSADDGINGQELWKSDGTAGGTLMVADINSTASSSPDNLIDVNGTLFFRANDGINGSELWKSDGTTANTVMVSDINPAGNSYPNHLINANGSVFFTADDGVNGFELWKSDGTTTNMVADINPSVGIGSSPSYLTLLNGVAYFAANDGTNGNELWKSDGLSSGTMMVKDILAGTSSSNPQSITAANGKLFMSADFGVGRELVISDGTQAGTESTDIYPGSYSYSVAYNCNWLGQNCSYYLAYKPNYSSPHDFIEADGNVYFITNNQANIYSLWVWKENNGVISYENVTDSTIQIVRALTNINGHPFFSMAYTSNANSYVTSTFNGQDIIDLAEGTSATSSYIEIAGKLFPNFMSELYATRPIVFAEHSIQTEGDTALVARDVAIKPLSPLALSVNISYLTEDISAFSGADYTAAAGSLTLPSGSLQQPFTMNFIGDGIYEYDETFFVRLSSPDVITVDGIVTIQDDDIAIPPTINHGGPYVANEGEPTTLTATVTSVQGAIATYTWNFGDGSAAGQGNPVTHTYADNGTYTVTLAVVDELQIPNTASTTVTVANLNPVSLPDSYSTNEDTVFAAMDVLLNDTDVSSDWISISQFNATSVNGGTIGDNGNDSLNYSPAKDFYGMDTFTYTVSDEDGGSTVETVTINVAAVDDVVAAVNGTLNLVSGSVANGLLQAYDVDSDPLTFSIIYPPSHGIVVLNDAATGTYTYTPNVSFFGVDTFTFQVNDGVSDSNLASVTVNVADSGTASNTPPTISGIPTTSVTAGATYSFTPTADDLDGNSLTFIIANQPSWASFDTGTGTLSGTPGDTDIGIKTNITIFVTDGNATTSLAPFDLTVIANPLANNAPVAIPQQLLTDIDTPLNIILSGADRDANTSLSYTIVNSPANGVLSGSVPNIAYTPNSGFTGNDVFFFKVNDGKVDSSNIAAINISVEGSIILNTPPTISGTPTTSVTAGSAYSFTPTANDLDGNPLSFIIANQPSWANFDTSTGTLSGTPINADAGTRTNVTLFVTDGNATASLPAFNLTVIADPLANNVPTAPLLLSPTNGATGIDGTNVVFEWENAVDPDGDTLSYQISYCTDASFAGCAPVNVAWYEKTGMVVAGLSGTSGLLMFGMLGFSTSRRQQLLQAGMVSLILALAACSQDGDTTVIQQITAGNETTSHTVANLNSGTTYYWKVTANDGQGGITDSVVWILTTQ